MKYLAGVSATIPTAPLGAVRGAANMAGDAIALEHFRERLADPLDRWKSPPGESAVEQLARTASAGGDYVAHGLRHPEDVLDDARVAAAKAIGSVNTLEAAQADSVLEAWAIGAQKGLNSGELAFNLVGPTKGARALTAARPLSYAERVEGFMRKDWPQAVAEHLAKPYEGPGHHYFPRRLLKAYKIPDFIGNSVFNMRKPAGISIGDFYEHHFLVDPKSFGNRLPGRRGRGSGWSGTRLGLKKYGPLGQIFLGAPEALQDSVGIALSGVEGATADALHRNEID